MVLSESNEPIWNKLGINFYLTAKISMLHLWIVCYLFDD